MLIALALAVAAGGCSTGTFLDDVPTLWGGDSRADKEREVAVEQARAAQVPVETVSALEVGRTRDGFLITAFGAAPVPGYSLPQLRPRRGGAPDVEGYVEYDFLATEPAGFELPAGTTRTRALRADLPVAAAALRGVRGIRVLGRLGGAQLDFAAAPPPQGGGPAATGVGQP